MQPTPQDNQLMSKHRVLSFKPQLRLEGRGQDGQSETEQPDHSASLGDSITSSTRIRFSVHTGLLNVLKLEVARLNVTIALPFGVSEHNAMPLMSNRFKTWLFGLFVLVCSAGLIAAYVQGHPRISLNPFCGVTFAYRLNVTIEFDGKHYSSELIGELLRNRINTGGVCTQSVGSILPFRLEDNRLVLISAHLCSKAVTMFAGGHDGGASVQGNERDGGLADDAFIVAMNKHQKINLAPLCAGVSQNRPVDYRDGYDGFVIDNADNPTRWRGFTFDRGDNDSISSAEHLSIVSAVAEAANLSPSDGLERVAPAILKTNFEYTEWSKSPDSMFYLRRRYGEQLIYNAKKELP
jgi:hypothetical protein